MYSAFPLSTSIWRILHTLFISFDQYWNWCMSWPGINGVLVQMEMSGTGLFLSSLYSPPFSVKLSHVTLNNLVNSFFKTIVCTDLKQKKNIVGVSVSKLGMSHKWKSCPPTLHNSVAEISEILVGRRSELVMKWNIIYGSIHSGSPGFLFSYSCVKCFQSALYRDIFL